MSDRTDMLSSDEILKVLNLTENAIAVYSSENLVIQMASEAMLRFWGKDRSIVGKPLREVVPEIKKQLFVELLSKVWNEGVSHEAPETSVQLMIDNTLQSFYFNLKFRAVKNEGGDMHCIIHTAEDVTQLRMSRLREQQLNEELTAINEELTVTNEELARSNDELNQSHRTLQIVNSSLSKSEGMFRNMILQAPIAIAIIKGPRLIFESVNPLMLQLIGKKPDIIGKPYAVALPEMENQAYLQLLKNVYTTGEPFFANEAKAFLERDGVLTEGFFNFIYKPIKDENGIANTIVAIAMDVTEQVLARQSRQTQG